jgi:uncharacterized membrane protein YvbJ
VTNWTAANPLRNHVTSNELEIGFVTLGNMRANNRNKTNLGEKIVAVISVLFFALIIIGMLFAYRAIF